AVVTLGGAAVGHRVEAPAFATRGRVEGEDLGAGGGAVEEAVDDDRIRLDLRERALERARVVGPGDLEPGDVPAIDLRERRVMGAADVAEIVVPIVIREATGRRIRGRRGALLRGGA